MISRKKKKKRLSGNWFPPQAQEDAEKLRSVVMPMEHEIAALKAKLMSAEERVKELEAAKVDFEEARLRPLLFINNLFGCFVSFVKCLM